MQAVSTTYESADCQELWRTRGFRVLSNMKGTAHIAMGTLHCFPQWHAFTLPRIMRQSHVRTICLEKKEYYQSLSKTGCRLTVRTPRVERSPAFYSAILSRRASHFSPRHENDELQGETDFILNGITHNYCSPPKHASYSPALCSALPTPSLTESGGGFSRENILRFRESRYNNSAAQRTHSFTS